MKKTALVAGSTGLVGREVVRQLAQSNDFDIVTAVVRKGSNMIHDGVVTIEVDYENLAAHKEDLKADIVFCCLGTTMKKAGSRDNFYKVDFTYPYELAKIAQENGSAQFNLVTAYLANSKSLFYYNRVKGDVEAAIQTISIPSINIFRPSLLIGKRIEKRAGERFFSKLAKVMNPVFRGKLKKYKPTEATLIARAMLNAALKEENGVHIYEPDDIRLLGLESIIQQK